ncbi:GntR family transcriptional regulator [Microbispora sp. NPDC088329]|uniref:GntR family transcriptional regulator n=1 Tax=Microbispora sp. NPDC088329 TaxID=3154869 RepID=UPI0034154BC5
MPEQKWASVSTPYIQPYTAGQADAWAEEAALHGHTGTHRLGEVGEQPAPKDVAERLQLTPGDPVVVRRRIVLLDERPVELADSYYPAAIARGTQLAEPRKVAGGAVVLLAELGYEPRHAEEDVYARPASEDERHALGLNEHGWVLVLTRTLRADNGKPIEVSVMKMNPQGRYLRYETTL